MITKLDKDMLALFESIVNKSSATDEKLSVTLGNIIRASNDCRYPNNQSNKSNPIDDRTIDEHEKVGNFYPIGVQRLIPFDYNYKPYSTNTKVLDWNPNECKFEWFTINEWRESKLVKQFHLHNQTYEMIGNTLPHLFKYIPFGMEIETVSRHSSLNTEQCDECMDMDAHYASDNDIRISDMNESSRHYCMDEFCGPNIRSSAPYGDDYWKDSFTFLTEMNLSFGAAGCKKKPVWIAKYDSSVDVEFVSHPMTKRAWDAGLLINKLLFDDSFNKYSNIAAAYHRDGVGAHIHFDKNVLNTLQSFAILQIHYENQDFIEFVGGRPLEGDWCEYYKPTFRRNDGSVDNNTSKIVNGTAHSAITKNVSGRGFISSTSDTFELRYFRGNLNPTSLTRNVEFVQSLYHYTRTLTYQDMARDKAHKLKWYLMFVRAYSKTYPNLYKKIKEGGYYDVRNSSN